MTAIESSADLVGPASAPGRLLFVINDLAFLISHRLPVAQAALEAGYEVHIAAPKDSSSEMRLAGQGFHLHRLSMHRHKVNPFSELRSIWQIFRTYRRLKPDTVHLITIKPVLYGGISARLAGVPAVVSAISGLGFAFSGRSFKSRAISRLVKPLYRLALGHSRQSVIFQNEHDRMTLENLGVDLSGKVEIIRGSGVDLAAYKHTPEPDGPVTVIVPSRLLHDKGIAEFVEAARILKRENSTARFVLVGDAPIENPGSISQTILDFWRTEGVVELWGFRADMPSVLSQAHIVVLPSYYREGLPKALIEAAACGRPVVTTDAPGCRDAIIADLTGRLVPVRDIPALADAMRGLIDDKATRLRMGSAGRALAEQAFSIEHVTRRHVEIYNCLSELNRSCG
ncbi:MAG TPA: glycosyltransferase family 4 protein [Thermohalobaculum sp.]|nr:glycosyltransferase family 4 protein [Thermohalobaculum sp.]